MALPLRHEPLLTTHIWKASTPCSMPLLGFPTAMVEESTVGWWMCDEQVMEMRKNIVW